MDSLTCLCAILLRLIQVTDNCDPVSMPRRSSATSSVVRRLGSSSALQRQRLLSSMAAALTSGMSASFKYLGIVFHESGGMTEALARLLQNGKGAAARLSAKHKALMCDQSFPMMRRLFDAVVRPTVLYGRGLGSGLLSGLPQLKDMQDIQLSFFRYLCQLCKSVTPHIIFRDFAERPWLDSWWSMVLGFMRRGPAGRRFCLRATCIWTFSKTTLQMPGSH